MKRVLGKKRDKEKGRTLLKRGPELEAAKQKGKRNRVEGDTEWTANDVKGTGGEEEERVRWKI